MGFRKHSSVKKYLLNNDSIDNNYDKDNSDYDDGELAIGTNFYELTNNNNNNFILYDD